MPNKSLIEQSVENNNLPLVQQLISKSTPSEIKTALIRATELGHDSIVEYLWIWTKQRHNPILLSRALDHQNYKLATWILNHSQLGKQFTVNEVKQYRRVIEDIYHTLTNDQQLVDYANQVTNNDQLKQLIAIGIYPTHGFDSAAINGDVDMMSTLYKLGVTGSPDIVHQVLTNRKLSTTLKLKSLQWLWLHDYEFDGDDVNQAKQFKDPRIIKWMREEGMPNT